LKVNIGILFEGDLGRLLARIPIHSYGEYRFSSQLKAV